MESNMVNNTYNFRDGEEAFSYLINLIAEKFSEFIVTKKTDIDMQKSKFGFFAIWILYKKIEFKICCERGILHYKLEVDNTEIGLHHFDEKMNDVLAFSKENIEYTLNVIKRYINEKKGCNVQRSC